MAPWDSSAHGQRPAVSRAAVLGQSPPAPVGWARALTMEDSPLCTEPPPVNVAATVTLLSPSSQKIAFMVALGLVTTEHLEGKLLRAAARSRGTRGMAWAGRCPGDGMDGWGARDGVGCRRAWRTMWAVGRAWDMAWAGGRRWRALWGPRRQRGQWGWHWVEASECPRARPGGSLPEGCPRIGQMSPVGQEVPLPHSPGFLAAHRTRCGTGWGFPTPEAAERPVCPGRAPLGSTVPIPVTWSM